MECGRGVDLVQYSYTDDEDVVGCEEAGVGLGEPSAGHLTVTYPARYLPGRQLAFSGTAVCRAGGVGDDREGVDLAAGREVHVLVDLHAGDAEATVWTNDLTHDYVHENSAYSS